MSDRKRKAKDISKTLPDKEAADDVSLSDSDPEEPTEQFEGNVEELTSSSEDEGPVQNQPVSQKNPFELTGGSTGFCFRSRDIFAHLDSAAKLASKDLCEDNVLDGTFARPAPPSPPRREEMRCGLVQDTTKKQSSGKKLPDYLANPERWTRYSLEDTAETSDKKNSQVALQYIQELQNSRRSKEIMVENFTPAFNQDHGSTSQNKIMFTKPKNKDQSGPKFDPAKKEVGLQHLDDGAENDGDLLKNEEKKRKWVSEKDRDEEPVSSVVFNSSKKVNRKHFRKSVEEDEADTE